MALHIIDAGTMSCLLKKPQMLKSFPVLKLEDRASVVVLYQLGTRRSLNVHNVVTTYACIQDVSTLLGYVSALHHTKKESTDVSHSHVMKTTLIASVTMRSVGSQTYHTWSAQTKIVTIFGAWLENVNETFWQLELGEGTVD